MSAAQRIAGRDNIEEEICPEYTVNPQLSASETKEPLHDLPLCGESAASTKKTLSAFRNVHRGETMLVCGCGESLK